MKQQVKKLRGPKPKKFQQASIGAAKADNINYFNNFQGALQVQRPHKKAKIAREKSCMD